MRRLVIVGNGRAAHSFLKEVQQYRYDFSICMIGDGKLPYKPAWYEYRGIELRLGVRVTSIDRHARLVKGSDGSVTVYDRLILAIGIPRSGGLSIPGLRNRNGLIVNDSMETSDGYIYAIGGCAELRDARWAATLSQQAGYLAAHLTSEADGIPRTAGAPGRRLRVVPRLAHVGVEEVHIA